MKYVWLVCLLIGLLLPILSMVLEFFDTIFETDFDLTIDMDFDFFPTSIKAICFTEHGNIFQHFAQIDSHYFGHID